tara:strand:+ start:48 stop:257 length:210 start_codon:yes stop_codon:yes gene_type:complete
MNNIINFNEEEKQRLVHDISNALNYVGAYDALHRLLVDRHEVLLHSDIENLANDLEDFIINWIQNEDND